MNVWLLVAGDFTTSGGMDMANFALARYLARAQGADREVHLVGHRASSVLSSLPAIRMHTVPRPLGAHSLGEPLMRFSARRWQRRLASRSVRTVANGGNTDAGDLNWVHYVHAAFRPDAAGTLNRLRAKWNHQRYITDERTALARARLVICNSARTADDVVTFAGVERERTRVVYYGIDSQAFGPIQAHDRVAARKALGLPSDRSLALFAGALGDRRKAFDTVFDAWRALCRRSDWDVDLLVVGTGAEMPVWQDRATRELPEGRMRFLGFRQDMPQVMAACDVLIHPARYEAYGLAVHEALCRGLPAIVSATAGVAERYPAALDSLLLQDPNSSNELMSRLQAWRSDSTIPGRVAAFASQLRSRTWDHMARDIEALAGES